MNEADVIALFDVFRADVDSEPFAHADLWVGDQTPEVPR